MTFLKRALLVACSMALLAPLAGCKGELADLFKACANCGEVESVEAHEAKGVASGGGAVVGAIVGGVVGHQFGSGTGNQAATAGGAIGGALAGHQIEKNLNKRLVYVVTVRMEKDGKRRVFNFDQPPPLEPGDDVKVTGNRIEID